MKNNKYKKSSNKQKILWNSYIILGTKYNNFKCRKSLFHSRNPTILRDQKESENIVTNQINNANNFTKLNRKKLI